MSSKNPTRSRLKAIAGRPKAYALVSSIILSVAPLWTGVSLAAERSPEEIAKAIEQNKQFDGLADQIDLEVDPAKRLALIRQAEGIFEQDPPVLPVAWEQINDVWWNYVKGCNPYEYFGIYDVARQDLFWLDK